jgi:hypothetical protein
LKAEIISFALINVISAAGSDNGAGLESLSTTRQGTVKRVPFLTLPIIDNKISKPAQ